VTSGARVRDRIITGLKVIEETDAGGELIPSPVQVVRRLVD
jgi:hypothetical protein